MAPDIHAAETANPGDVIVIDVITDGMGTPLSTTMGASPWNTAEWLIVETDPADQSITDWGSGFPGFPTIPLIDLTTMEVLVRDCWDASSYEACVAPYV